MYKANNTLNFQNQTMKYTFLFRVMVIEKISSQVLQKYRRVLTKAGRIFEIKFFDLKSPETESNFCSKVIDYVCRHEYLTKKTKP